jgi:hypothetical protein
VFEFSLSNPSAEIQRILYIHQWNCWKHYTTTSQTVPVPAGATGTVSVPTTADTIDENNEDFSIASGTVTGTINIMMRLQL